MKIMIISGFLGAGKTTWIRDFLHRYKDLSGVCVIENDFGPLNVDQALLGDAGVSIRSLASGCVCCSISGSLIETLNAVRMRLKPELVLIEPSGVAKLSELKCALNKGGYRTDYALTVVDGSRWQQNLDNYDEYFEDQVRHADAVLVNQWSFEEDARDFMREFPGVRLITSTVSLVTAEMIWDSAQPSATPLLDALRHDAHDNTHEAHHCEGHDHEDHHEDCHESHDHAHEHHHGHHHEHPDFRAETVGVEKDAAEAWLSRFELNLEGLKRAGWVRAKGVVDTASGMRILQWRGSEMNLEPCPGEAAEQAGEVVFIGNRTAEVSALDALKGRTGEA